MKKEWFFDRYCGQQFAALIENGKLTEYAAEKETNKEIVGNIYKGKVVNVLHGMNAAFIHCGLNKNCYLSMEETYTDYTKYDGTMGAMNPVLSELKEGDEIIVQVTKPSRGNKGAKVTTHLSFVGKRIIFLPNTNFLGISRKIEDEKTREILLKTADKLRENTQAEGFIMRTQAPFATQKQLKTEADYLKKLYREMVKMADKAQIGDLLYAEEDLPVRVMRDSFGDEIVAMHVGEKGLYERLLKFVKLRGDIPERKLILYTGKRALFTEYGISPLIQEAVQPVVQLENGGYLVIDHTEAMTVVDVNSGGFVGDKNLEDTVFSVNLAAAQEIARQVRLRNTGGIVVVDFIDMAEEEHKLAVTQALRAELAKDKAKCNVLEMSEFCLTQFTRKRVGSEVNSYLVKPCEHCLGNGYVLEDIFTVSKIRSELLDCFASGYLSAVVELNEKLMKKILNERLFVEEVNGIWKNKRVYFIPHKTYREDSFSVRGDNSGVLTLSDKAQILY